MVSVWSVQQLCFSWRGSPSWFHPPCSVPGTRPGPRPAAGMPWRSRWRSSSQTLTPWIYTPVWNVPGEMVAENVNCKNDAIKRMSLNGRKGWGEELKCSVIPSCCRQRVHPSARLLFDSLSQPSCRTNCTNLGQLTFAFSYSCISIATGYSLEYQPTHWEKDGAWVAEGNGTIQKVLFFLSWAYLVWILIKFSVCVHAWQWDGPVTLLRRENQMWVSLDKSIVCINFTFNIRWRWSSNICVLIKANTCWTKDDGGDIVEVYVSAQA